MLYSSILTVFYQYSYLEAEGMEKTFKFTQEQIRNNLDLASQNKVMNSKLNEFRNSY
jgi:U3 small nucleolar RNA-associated protein 7